MAADGARTDDPDRLACEFAGAQLRPLVAALLGATPTRFRSVGAWGREAWAALAPPQAVSSRPATATGTAVSATVSRGGSSRWRLPPARLDRWAPPQPAAGVERLGVARMAAFQARNPMQCSTEDRAEIAIEVCDGVLVHSLLGNLKPGDIPAGVRACAISVLIDKYFCPGTVVQAGYPLDMRYAGPREALLHALFRQNYGCSHQIVGRDHAGVGSYYGPFDAHRIFDEIPANALATQPLKIDWTFWCYRCGGMASARTCPHDDVDRLLVSGTKLRKWLSEGQQVPQEFSRPEVLQILREYYASLEASERVEVKLGGHSAR